MPTADAFDTAARSFDRAAADLSQLLVNTPQHFGPDTLIGGMLSLVADITVSTAQATATSAAATHRRRPAGTRPRSDVITRARSSSLVPRNEPDTCRGHRCMGRNRGSLAISRGR